MAGVFGGIALARGVRPPARVARPPAGHAQAARRAPRSRRSCSSARSSGSCCSSRTRCPEQALKGFPADLASFVVPEPLHPARHDPRPRRRPLLRQRVRVPRACRSPSCSRCSRSRRAAGGPRGVVLVGARAATAVASLGRELVVAGTETGIPLPWALFEWLPALEYAIPVRFTGFTFLAAARGGGALARLAWRARALGARARGRGRSCCRTSATRSGGRRSPIPPCSRTPPPTTRVVGESDRVLTRAGLGSQHALAGRGRTSTSAMAAGYVGAFPRSYQRYPGWQMILSGRLQPGYARELRRFVRDKGVTVMLQDSRYDAALEQAVRHARRPPRARSAACWSTVCGRYECSPNVSQGCRSCCPPTTRSPTSRRCAAGARLPRPVRRASTRSSWWTTAAATARRRRSSSSWPSTTRA